MGSASAVNAEIPGMQRVSSAISEVDNVLEGMCYTPNVPSASNCTNGASYVENLRMCLKEDITNKDECTGNDKCDVRRRPLATAPPATSEESASISNKAAKYLSCRRDKRYTTARAS